MHYNFVKIHSTLRTTPAQAAGVTDRLWDVSDLVELLEESESARGAVRCLAMSLSARTARVMDSVRVAVAGDS